jgi:effector-binding domain-containing protein
VKWRWTWPGVTRPSGRGCSQGRRTSLTSGRANHNCQQAPAISQVQRSAASALRGRTVLIREDSELDIAMKAVPEQQIISTVRDSYIGDLQAHLHRSIKTLTVYAQASGIRTFGLPMALYHGAAREDKHAPVEVCLPVTGDIHSTIEIVVKELPAATVAYTTTSLRQSIFQAYSRHMKRSMSGSSTRSCGSRRPSRDLPQLQRVHLQHDGESGRSMRRCPIASSDRQAVARLRRSCGPPIAGRAAGLSELADVVVRAIGT